MIEYNGVNHLAMATGDMDATIRYWRDLLGMRMVVALGHPGYRHYFFEISDSDTIAFFEWPGIEPIPDKDHGAPVKGPHAFDHVSIGVSEQDMLWEIKDRLEAAGFWVSEAVDHGFIHSIYTFDPNNIPVEFSWSVPERDIRLSPIMSDKAPEEIAQEGPDPQPGRWPEVKSPTAERDKKVYPGMGSELFHRKRGK